MAIHVFGIRHHGPGSARSLVKALDELKPDIILVEGPPDAAALIPLAANPELKPPAAILVYAPDEPGRATVHPFALFSPEWQALRFALKHSLPVAFMDLPQSVQFALEKANRETEEPSIPELPAAPENENEEPVTNPPAPSFDPLMALAEAAGYNDGELWWEHMVEQRQDSLGLFAGILEAMTALRESIQETPDDITLLREAHMRQTIRAAQKQGFEMIAVVCGAWHAPALVNLPPARQDENLLKGLPKLKVQATWIPWTYSRLSRASGYGAGIRSPGWFHHLWETPQDSTNHWMVKVARLLREADFDVSSAHIIEAVRLAETLAALRDLPLPGLPEMNEAAQTVFCFGDPTPMHLINDQLIVGEVLGTVPADIPQAPLQQDLQHEQKRLRLPLEPYEKIYDLDLRKDFDLDRSRLFHRLNLLNIPWGINHDASIQSTGSGRGGTFHEIWRVKWLPEFPLQLIEAGAWGSTIETAACQKAIHIASELQDLPQLTSLVETVLLADLPEAIQAVTHKLQEVAATANDIPLLMTALPSLGSVLRYGNVRQTDLNLVQSVIDHLIPRICIGLSTACSNLDDDAAAHLFEAILSVNQTISTLQIENYVEQWHTALLRLMASGNVHNLLNGRACRILLDTGKISVETTSIQLSQALSTGNDPVQASAWLQGFLYGSGQFLIHDDTLLTLVDQWLVTLPESTFLQVLPLLRRTFASFTMPERRGIGEQISKNQYSKTITSPIQTHGINTEQAIPTLMFLVKLFGLEKQQEVHHE